MKKFTFKTTKPIGRYRSFSKPYHEIKLNKQAVGLIDADEPHKISLKVVKADINEDGNPNCAWKWLRLKKESKSLQEAKDYLIENQEVIMSQRKIYLEEK